MGQDAGFSPSTSAWRSVPRTSCRCRRARWTPRACCSGCAIHPMPRRARFPLAPLDSDSAECEYLREERGSTSCEDFHDQDRFAQRHRKETAPKSATQGRAAWMDETKTVRRVRPGPYATAYVVFSVVVSLISISLSEPLFDICAIARKVVTGLLFGSSSRRGLCPMLG